MKRKIRELKRPNSFLNLLYPSTPHICRDTVWLVEWEHATKTMGKMSCMYFSGTPESLTSSDAIRSWSAIWRILITSRTVKCINTSSTWSFEQKNFITPCHGGKGEVFPLQAHVAQRVGRGIALLFHDRGTRRGWVVSSTPRPHFTPGKTGYPFYRRLGGPQGRSGRAENLVSTGIFFSWVLIY